MNVTPTFELLSGKSVSRIGFGAMRLTGQPGNFGPYHDWESGKRLLQHAVESGVQFFDSAFAYGPQWSDKIIADALSPYSDELVIATKGGVDKPAPGKAVVDASPETLTKQIDIALSNLKTDCIDLFQLHRVDPNIPLEDSIGALEQARSAGKIEMIGLSNVTRQQLETALEITEIASVQNRFNQSEHEDEDLVEYTNSKGIAYLPWGPLGADPFKQGAKLPPRESIAWLLKRSPNIVAIPGTTSSSHLDENLTAWDLVED